ncbi:hypothetical protein JB92DRAFT_1998495 [Gautieria morchelliformis]|nr:hypothetical protein JB92DRAFT_1998495 [Gautieria morchelliformis]
MSHVGETVVIRILWGRRRASDTQSRQNKGQENAQLHAAPHVDRQDHGRAGAGGRGPTHRQEDGRNGSNRMPSGAGHLPL